VQKEDFDQSNNENWKKTKQKMDLAAGCPIFTQKWTPAAHTHLEHFYESSNFLH
jgi:hypothetical protein